MSKNNSLSLLFVFVKSGSSLKVGVNNPAKYLHHFHLSQIATKNKKALEPISTYFPHHIFVIIVIETPHFHIKFLPSI